jgi:hypothetical protein
MVVIIVPVSFSSGTEPMFGVMYNRQSFRYDATVLGANLRLSSH